MARRGLPLSEQIAAFARKVQQRADAFVENYGILVLQEIVSLSPVGDPRLWKSPPPEGYVGGHFLANWQVTIGRPATGTVDRIDGDGGETLAAGRAVLSGVRAGQSVFITNNLEYARRLEYGWSTQAPSGMVRVTVAQSQTLKRQALALARRAVP